VPLTSLGNKSFLARCDVTAQTGVGTTQNVMPFVADVLAPLERPSKIDAGDVLFREGDEPRGVYFVHDGRFDLVFSSRGGDAKPLRTADTGQILGLSCIVSNRPHDCSATARCEAMVGFIPKDEFQQVLDSNPQLWLTVLQMISSDISACWDCMRSLGKC
jgi:CRP/FNR family transcriptional regulator, polysaccharide utilization system transcription regulator